MVFVTTIARFGATISALQPDAEEHECYAPDNSGPTVRWKYRFELCGLKLVCHFFQWIGPVEVVHTFDFAWSEDHLKIAASREVRGLGYIGTPLVEQFIGRSLRPLPVGKPVDRDQRRLLAARQFFIVGEDRLLVAL